LTREQTILLYILIQKFAVKVISDCVIDEPLCSLELPSCLVLKDDIIIPPALNNEGGWIQERIASHKLLLPSLSSLDLDVNVPAHKSPLQGSQQH
jgi:hypothetical protein